MRAKWPSSQPVDENLSKSYEYLMSSSHSFRLRLKNHYNLLSKQGKSAKSPKIIAKPTHGTIYVAHEFPLWQSLVLKCLKDLYEVIF